jgi:hypothetical protein
MVASPLCGFSFGKLRTLFRQIARNDRGSSAPQPYYRDWAKRTNHAGLISLSRSFGLAIASSYDADPFLDLAVGVQANLRKYLSDPRNSNGRNNHKPAHRSYWRGRRDAVLLWIVRPSPAGLSALHRAETLKELP